MTCLIVEDQVMFLELLQGMLAIRGGLRILGRAETVTEGVAACIHHAADLLLLDLALPDGDGLVVAKRFIEANSAGRVIVITGHANSFVCPAWLNRNLQAVISKNDTFQALRAELDELLPSRGPAIRGTAPRPASKPLTKREAEVFALMGEGLSSQAIAARLGVSLHTVLTHRKRLAMKLGTRGLELTKRAVAQRAAFFPRRGEHS
jgi:DNA-binding NarL/FixJ family response regulator